MTFVKSKLAYERAKPGETIEIRLCGEEPIMNVPRALADSGAAVLSQTDNGDGVVVLRIKKALAA